MSSEQSPGELAKQPPSQPDTHDSARACDSTAAPPAEVTETSLSVDTTTPSAPNAPGHVPPKAPPPLSPSPGATDPFTKAAAVAPDGAQDVAGKGTDAGNPTEEDAGESDHQYFRHHAPASESPPLSPEDVPVMTAPLAAHPHSNSTSGAPQTGAGTSDPVATAPPPSSEINEETGAEAAVATTPFLTPTPLATTETPAAGTAASAAAATQAWVIDFGSAKPRPKRKMTKKEQNAIATSRQRGAVAAAVGAAAAVPRASGTAAGSSALGADSEGNRVTASSHDTPARQPQDAASPTALQVVQLDEVVDRAALIPTDLTTTRADLEERLVLRLPRLLCVNKQYPRGCGIASLTSVYNYLYSRLGESTVGAERPPIAQEEIMSILGFEPPFGEIAWGPFTGNATLIRWFYALNRHFGLPGRAYILYKAHGAGKTTHLYPDNAAALAAVKAALRSPNCALIYHCHNHYMVPIGYQDIPHAQVDFLTPTVPESNCETTLYIGEVSRGRHEAMYARKWSQIVKDMECKSPFFFNIRHPEQGVQRRESKKKKTAADSGDDRGAAQREATAHASAAALDNQPSLIFSEASNAATHEADTTNSTDATTAADATPKTGAAPESLSAENVNSSNGAGEEAEAGVILPARTSARTTPPPEEAATEPADTTRAAPPPTPAPSNAEPQDAAQPPSTPQDVFLNDTPRNDTSVLETPPSAAQPDDGAASKSPNSAPPSDPTTPTVEAVDEGMEAALVADVVARRAQDFDGCIAFEEAAAPHDVETTAAAAPATSPVNAPGDAPAPVRAAKRGTAPRTKTREAASTPTTAATAAPPAKRKERGNLHCLIIFRSDQVETHLERYEEEVPSAFAVRRAVVSATSSSSSSDSDECVNSGEDA